MISKWWASFYGLRREWRITVVASCLATLILLIFLALIPLQKWLWTGWGYGTLVALICYAISVKITHYALRNGHSKAEGIFFSVLRVMLVYALHAGFLLLLIFINNIYFGHAFFEHYLADLADGPLNIFTYLAGISIIIVSIAISEGIYRLNQSYQSKKRLE